MKETPPRGVRAGVLAGRYRVLELIGAGGMGSVHRGVHEGLDREVAVKFIGSGRGATIEQVQRFEREARLLARLSHPSIVTVHDFGRADDGTWFLVLELVRGESLQARLDRGGALPMLEAVDVARHIALALAAAHDASVLHRDLKPGNVMLSAATAAPVKLIDFGLARIVDKDATGSYVMGTPGYIAPETASAGVLGPAADHWALGVVLFEMLTGVHPFQHAFGQHGAGDAAAVLTARAPTLPTSLRAFVLALLAADPAARPASPAQDLTDLARTLQPSSPSSSASSASSSPSPSSPPSAPTVTPPRPATPVTARERPQVQRPQVEVAAGLVFLVVSGQLVSVRVPAFTIDKHLVTCGDWWAFMQATGAAAPSSWPSSQVRPERARLAVPVVDVSFDDAAAFAAWSGRRLPTEAEWELAARGDDGRAFPWGSTWMSGLAHPTHEVEFERRQPGPIGVFSPQGDSPSGVSDLCQIWEWVTAPYQTSGNLVRGGPWRDRTAPAELQNRSWEDLPARDVGFRCAWLGR